MKMYNASEAGEQLGLTANTVINWIRLGRIFAHVYPGGKRDVYRIPASEVNRLLGHYSPEGSPDA